MSFPHQAVRCPRCQSAQLVAAHQAHLPRRCATCGELFQVPGTQTPAYPPRPQPQQYLPPHLQGAGPAYAAPPNPVPLANTSPPITPRAVVLDEETPRAHSRFKQGAWGAALVIVPFSILVLGSKLPGVLKHFQQSAAKPVAGRSATDESEEQPVKSIPEPAEAAVAQTSEPSSSSGDGARWTVAAQSPIQRKGVEVKILRCEHGEVMASDGQTPAGPGDFLTIHVQIANLGPREVSYVSWYGNKFREDDVRGRQVAINAELTDQQGRVFPFQKFLDVRSIEGNIPHATIGPGAAVRDVIVYALPSAKAQGMEELFLRLPAASFREQGWLEFKLTPELWK